MKTTPERLVATTSTLAQLLNLSVRRVQQLIEAGLLPKPGPDGHRLLEAVPAYVKLLRRPSQSKDLAEARTKLLEVQTKIREVELREKCGDLIAKSTVESKWFTLGREVRDTLSNLAPRIAGLVAAERNQEKCFTIIDTEVRLVLETLSGGHA